MCCTRPEYTHLPHCDLYLQTLALTSSTSGGRSVGIVCSQTKATEEKRKKYHSDAFPPFLLPPERMQATYILSKQNYFVYMISQNVGHKPQILHTDIHQTATAIIEITKLHVITRLECSNIRLASIVVILI
jgi:hypothetical protein